MVFLFGSKALALPTGLLCGPLPHREGSHSGGKVRSPLGKAAKNVPFASAGGRLSVFAHRKRPFPYSPAERMQAWQPITSNTLHPRCTEGGISLFRPTKKAPAGLAAHGNFFCYPSFPPATIPFGNKGGGRPPVWLAFPRKGLCPGGGTISASAKAAETAVFASARSPGPSPPPPRRR